MTPQHVISQLLESDIKHQKNLDLLKKIIITAYLGRFRVNGLSPDNKITLGNYIFDDERIMLDFTHLSDEKRIAFKSWLLDDHQIDKEKGVLSSIYVNEYRGFTAEVFLSWWGRLKNWIQGNYSEQWKINDLNILSLNYQLNAVEMCHGKNGILIGFNQFLVPPSGDKYKAATGSQNESIGNTKRVFITNRLVDQLSRLNLKSLRFESICKSPHPQSIDVTNSRLRQEEMYAHRKVQSFVYAKPWYSRLWAWIASVFRKEKTAPSPVLTDNELVLLHKTETTEIYQRTKTRDIVVTERRPDIKNIVLCGGGAKIFAHIGVWRALNEAKIKPKQFAGSSAGAIMALMCYLGYSADEIAQLFKYFRQEHLVEFDIDRNGLSDTHSLKTALDYAITRKVNEIVAKYNISYPSGKITFSALEQLKNQCPGCGIGDNLIVTATNKRLQETRYFSSARTPQMEVSEAVKISSSFPVVYRETLLNGEEYNDGGVLSNFPTEVFSDDNSTLLESGNNLSVLAVQFDNGTERTAVDRILEKVYKENFFLNWLYSFLTGVSDPASAWERDRLKLRQYALQTIVPNVDHIPTSGFSVQDINQSKMIDIGYQATKDYLDIRYVTKEDGYENKELMYSSFTSLGDLLGYCCYRGNLAWFEIVNNLIAQSTLPNRTALMKQSLELRALYFKPGFQEQESHSKPLTFFENAQPAAGEEPNDNHKILLALFPIFLNLKPEMAKEKLDRKIMVKARHSLNLHRPFRALEHFETMQGDIHVMLHILMSVVKALGSADGDNKAYLYSLLEKIHAVSCKPNLKMTEKYFSSWDLTLPQCKRVMDLLIKDDEEGAECLLDSLRDKVEPLQVINNGVYRDELDDDNLNFRLVV